MHIYNLLVCNKSEMFIPCHSIHVPIELATTYGSASREKKSLTEGISFTTSLDKSNHRYIRTRLLTNQRDRSYVYPAVSLLAAILWEDRPYYRAVWAVQESTNDNYTDIVIIYIPH